MSFPELFAIAVALAMDAFAVSVCAGCALKRVTAVHFLRLSLTFGFFQFLMPVIGWALGLTVRGFIESWDHWIAFALLAWIGGNMIRESLGKEEDCECCDPSLAFGTMLMLALATSIDALAVGVGFALLKVNILAVVLSIGLCTFLISAVGVKIGNVFGARFKSKAEFLGGVVLVLMGLKILLEHLGVIHF